MENYEEVEVIASGPNSKVSKVRRKADGKLLVSKELSYGKMTEKEKQQVVSEVNILRELRHPNIVKYYDRIIDKTSQRIYILMEYCEGGDMATFLKKLRRDKETLPEETVWKIFMQLVFALSEIHRRKEGKILHRDIKPANIFLDGQNNIKLGDFGLSKQLPVDSTFANTQIATPYYQSPEQLTDNLYNEKSDIWSAGCFLYELCTLSPPFEASNHLALALKIKSGKFDRIPSRYSDELQRTITWILTRKHEERPSVDDLVNIPWISKKLREKRLKENKALLKKREDDLKSREAALIELENSLKQKESDLKIKEKLMQEQEKKLKELEDGYKNKENISYTANTYRGEDRTFTTSPKMELNFQDRKPTISKTMNFGSKPLNVGNYTSFNTTFERNTSIMDNTSNITRTYYSIDKDNNTIDTSNVKISKHPSFRNEEPSIEGGGNTEIGNILRQIDRIKVDSSDEEGKDWEKKSSEKKAEVSKYTRQNLKKMY